MKIIKFLKFGTVGALGFVVDFSITYLLLHVLGFHELISNAIGFTFAAIFNYMLNRLWTFRSKNPNVKAEFIRFFIVSLIGLGINNLIIISYLAFIDWSLVLPLGGIASIADAASSLPHVFILPSFWIAKILATGFVMIWNFVVNSKFTFRS